ncbi:MAG TPA: hypothetical protein VMT90_09815 [Dehalococcoidia bacterium]|jgi:hypothetical protein|nr:hypothetical protein [Dehalococcoidia bacterium]
MATDTGRINPALRGWRWLLSVGLGVPLIAGAALVLLVIITWVSPRYEATRSVNIGPASTYAVGQPVYHESDRFWVVKVPSGEVLALYDRDPITGCTVPWDPNYVFLGVKGWFRDACSRSVYDMQGACFDGPCVIGLNRLAINEDTNGELVVDMNSGGAGPIRTPGATPLTLP